MASKSLYKSLIFISESLNLSKNVFKTLNFFVNVFKKPQNLSKMSHFNEKALIFLEII
jgi:hypothetical protein